MASKSNYYRVLGLTPDASMEEIKKAYRRLAVKHHPDRSSDSDSKHKFHLISEAYRILSDENQRKQYDKTYIHPEANQFRPVWQQKKTATPNPRRPQHHVDPWEVYQQAEQEQQAEINAKRQAQRKEEAAKSNQNTRPRTESESTKEAAPDSQQQWTQNSQAKSTADDFLNSDAFRTLFKQFTEKQHKETAQSNAKSAAQSRAESAEDSRPQAEATTQTTPPPEEPKVQDNPNPVFERCYECGCDDQLLQYKRIYTTTAWGRSSQTKVKKGKYCPRCFGRLSRRANLKTLMLGWWAPRGALDSLRSLIANQWRHYEYKREENAWLAYHHLRKLFRDGRRAEALRALCYAYQLTLEPAFKQQLREQILRQVNYRSWRYYSLFIRSWLHQHFSLTSYVLIACLLLTLGGLMYWDVHKSPQAVTHVSSTELDTDSFQRYRLYPEFRMGENYVLSEQLKLRFDPSVSAPVVSVLDKYEALYVDGISEDGQWLKVTTANGQQGYVAERYVGFGEGARAKEKQCDHYPARRLASGTLLFASEKGKHALIVNNPHDEDALVQLIAVDGGGLYRFYVRKNDTVTMQGIATGEYQLIQQRGQVFNPECGIFMKKPVNAQLEGAISLLIRQQNQKPIYQSAEIFLP